MRFLFRTDANPVIGTGHLMRCLALADGLTAAGAECVFLCREYGLGNLAIRVRNAGHTLILLPAQAIEPHGSSGTAGTSPEFLPGGCELDAAACRAALDGTAKADWLIVDHYAIDDRWHRAMRACAEKLMVIDDLADRQYDCDLLLDQSLMDDIEHRYDDLVPDHCVRLLGPHFALLRDEFSQLARMEFRRDDNSSCVLIMFGGSDPRNLTLRSVKALAAIDWRGRIDVVAGPLYADLPALRAALEDLGDAHLHAPADRVASLMSRATFALGSPGSSSWERCACALPSLTIAQAENQVATGQVLGRLGAHVYLGKEEDLSDDILAAALKLYLSNLSARMAMSHAASSICDGNGVQRVVRRLLPVRLSVTRARRGDADMLFSWRNDEGNRRFAHDSRPLVLSEHLDWIERTLARTDVDLLIVRHDDLPVACVRFDHKDSRAQVSIYLDPQKRHCGMGKPSLLAALEWIGVERPGVVVTDADVLSGNDASQALFKAAGYRLVWSRYERPQIPHVHS